MFCDTNESESCLVKAPAKHASDSVPVVGELLSTGVQANTEKHTMKETREMCSCWDTNNTSPHANLESGVIQTSNRARVWQIWEARKDHLKSSHVQKVLQSLRFIQLQPLALYC